LVNGFDHLLAAVVCLVGGFELIVGLSKVEEVPVVLGLQHSVSPALADFGVRVRARQRYLK
jgi:hypothetical protein